jgi:hypothetical protein
LAAGSAKTWHAITSAGEGDDMMLKVSGVAAQDFGGPTTTLVPLLREGRLGPNDRRLLEKRAGVDFMSALRRVKLAEDEVPIHTIALGSTEFYGPNRNGDGFVDKVLEKYAHTFEKYARFYRNHANRRPEKSYGRIIKAAYNRPMHRIDLLVGLNGSEKTAAINGGLVADKELEILHKGESIPTSMACKVAYDVCFSAGSLVETEHGLRAIESISSGMLVRTHTGGMRPVIATMQRAYVGTMVTLSVMGIPEPLHLTEQHPLYLVRRESLIGCRGLVTTGRTNRGSKLIASRRHTFRDGESVCVTCNREPIVRRDWIAARDIHIGDFALYPVQLPGGEEIGAPRAYLLGLYSGDGSPIRTRRGRRRNGDYALRGISVTLDDAIPAVIELTCDYAKVIHGREQPTYASGGGKASRQVHIYSREIVDDAIRYVGEGCKTKRIDPAVFDWCREDRLHFLAGALDSDGSVDRGVRYGSGRHLSTNRQLAGDIQRLWWGLGVPACMHTEVSESSYSGLTAIYVVAIPRYAVAMLDGYSAKATGITPPVKVHSQAFLRDGYMHLPIQHIVEAHDELDVFNLAVTEDESYIVGVAAHNCSGCGNKARTRAEYCSGYGQCKYGGLKHNITVTFDDGHQLHADNPEPYWFDESHVYKPADRIAWSLGALLPLEKSASARPMGGAELAEAIGLAAPIELLIDPTLPRRVQAQVKLAHDLAERESGAAHDTWGYAFVPESRQSIRDLPDVHSSPSQLGRVLRALASEKVALSVHDFLALMIDKHAAATVAVDVGAQLPGIFGRLARDPDLEDMLRSSPYNPADEVPDTKLRRWAATLVPEYGLGRKEAEARVTRACVQCRVPRIRAQTDETVKEAADHGGAEKLARQYALYQLAFLSAVGERDEAEIPLTSTLLVRQNHVF